jgi:hypothetical protein
VYSIVLTMAARPKSIPCIKYEDKLDLTDMSMVKIEGLNYRTHKVPVFAPAMKVEGCSMFMIWLIKWRVI